MILSDKQRDKLSDLFSEGAKILFTISAGAVILAETTLTFFKVIIVLVLIFVFTFLSINLIKKGGRKK